MSLRADEEVSLTARGPTTRSGRHRGERPDYGFIAAGNSPFGELSPAPKAVDPQLRRPEKQGWNRSLGKGRLVNSAGPVN